MLAKRVLVASALMMSMCGVAHAAPPSWQGTFIVTGVTSGCASSDNTLGEYGTILYRPVINQGDPAEGISLFFPRSTQTIISVNATFRGYTAYNGVETGSHVYPNVFKGGSNLIIQPSVITATTDIIHIKGNIDNFFNNTPDCDVNIEAVLIPRI